MAAIRRRCNSRTAIPDITRRLSSTSSLPPPPPPDHPVGASAGGEDDALAAAAVEIIKEHRSRTRWSYLRSLRPAGGFPPAASAAIIAGLRSRPRMALSFLAWSGNLDLPSLTSAAHVAARSRLRSPALDALRSAVRLHDPAGDGEDDARPPEVLRSLISTYHACGSAPFVFDLLIEAYLAGGRLDRAIQITRLLLRSRHRPSPAMANSLVRSFSRRRGADSGLEIFKEISRSGEPRTSPDVRIFNTLLLAFHREGRGSRDRIEQLRGEMARFGIDGNVFTYSVLMAGHCEDGRIGDARAIWEEMAAKGISPDATAFNTMIAGCCLAGEVGEAEELHRKMVFMGIEPTWGTLEQIVAGHVAAGDVDAAELVCGDMMRRRGMPPPAEVDGVIEGMCGKGRTREAMGLMKEAAAAAGGEEVGFRPGRRSYEAVIEGLCGAGEVEEAMRIQAEMAGKGFPPGSRVYCAFVEAYERRGDGDMARKMREEMVGVAGNGGGWDDDD